MWHYLGVELGKSSQQQKKMEEKINNSKQEINTILNNMVTVKNYEGALNQFLIIGDGYTLFQSYSSPIALVTVDGQVYIFENWNASKTTAKYRNLFLNETKKETQAKLDKGEYVFVNEK